MNNSKQNTTTGEYMLIMINMTGLKKTYWIPSVERNKADGIWYVGVKFLFVQVIIFNKVLGGELMRVMSDEKTWRIYEH